MTDKQFIKFCQECKSDLLSDFGEEADNASYYYDMAEGILMTDPELREYCKKKGIEKSMWNEFLAEEIACAEEL